MNTEFVAAVSMLGKNNLQFESLTISNQTVYLQFLQNIFPKQKFRI